MIRFTILTFTVLTALVSLSCQQYSTGLQQSVVRADETSVVAELHAIVVAEQTYSVSNGGTYGTFEQLRAGDFLEARFSSPDGIKNYALTLSVKPQAGSAPASYSCNADPTNSGPQAGRHFYVDSTSQLVHVNANQPATTADPVYGMQ